MKREDGYFVLYGVITADGGKILRHGDVSCETVGEMGDGGRGRLW